MSRKRFSHMNCSVAQALEVLGDWWTLLIIRDAFLGMHRFAEFQADLGIARNILADRLAHLVQHGVLEKRDIGRRGRHFEYHLTEKGSDLLPLLTAMRQWADRWVFGEGHEPLLVRERESGRPIARLRVTDERGRPLERWQLRVEPGPGATRETRARFTESRSQSSGRDDREARRT